MSTPVDREVRYRALDDDRNVVGKGILPALTEEDALDALRHHEWDSGATILQVQHPDGSWEDYIS